MFRRLPQPRRYPPPDLCYAVVVKERAHGRVVHVVPVQVVKTGLTPQIAPSDRLREAETVQRHPAGPLRTPR